MYFFIIFLPLPMVLAIFLKDINFLCNVKLQAEGVSLFVKISLEIESTEHNTQLHD